MRSRPTRSRVGVEYPQHMAATNLWEETCSELVPLSSKYLVAGSILRVPQGIEENRRSSFRRPLLRIRFSGRRLPRNFPSVASSTSVKETRDRDEEEGSLGAIRKWPLRATPLARLICDKRPVMGSG
ncbi:hypothetical protein V1478_009065 [Vespula squamosa]|uniref:Uncharacterized protein n=1 Tax=Vespula squamosa TaxID=30214 RepID=A0ABD2AW75_VESSQ